MKKTEQPTLRDHIERFAQSDCSWVSTVRPDGRAHLAPMWHVWYQSRVYLVTPDNSVKTANISQNPSVSISHPDPSNVIVIEGEASIANENKEMLQPLFQTKYDWNILTDTQYQTVVEIVPHKLMAWNSGPVQRWGRDEIAEIAEI